MEEIKREPQKKTLSETLEEHPKTVFWSRFVSWAMFSCILPFLFIVYRFKLFGKISKIQIGGWGIVAIVIAAAFVFTVIRYIKLAFAGRYSLVGQILSGICKVILPLGIFMVLLYNIKNNVDIMIQVLGCVISCEAIAIPLNPLPKWAYDMQKDVRDSEKKDTIDYLLTEFFKRKKESE